MNKATDKGGTSLMVASLHGHLNVAKMLIEAGANPKQQTSTGETAATLARQGGPSRDSSLLHPSLLLLSSLLLSSTLLLSALLSSLLCVVAMHLYM